MGAAEGGVSTPSAQSSRPPSTAVSAWPNSSTLKCNEPRIDGRATNSTLVAQKLGYWGNYQRGHTGDRGMLGYIGGLGFSKLGLMPALPYGCPRGVVASLGTLTDADKQVRLQGWEVWQKGSMHASRRRPGWPPCMVSASGLCQGFGTLGMLLVALPICLC